jgi:nucleotide-binding universal stress UspA family protein
MSNKDETNTDAEERGTSEEQEQEEPTFPAETSQDNPTTPTEKRVIRARSTKTEYGLKASEEQEEESLTAKVKGVGQSFKDLLKAADKKETSSVASQPQVSDANLEYNRILVPHDGSKMSDKALNHAIYLSSKLASTELVILSVLQHLGDKDSSALLVTSKAEGAAGGGKANKKEKEGDEEDLEIAVEGNVKQMIEERIRLCKESGVKSQISYKIQTGKPVDEIVKLSEEMDVSLIVMASSRITSSIKALGSTTRKVIDNAKKPVLVIHQ